VAPAGNVIAFGFLVVTAFTGREIGSNMIGFGRRERLSVVFVDPFTRFDVFAEGLLELWRRR